MGVKPAKMAVDTAGNSDQRPWQARGRMAVARNATLYAIWARKMGLRQGGGSGDGGERPGGRLRGTLSGLAHGRLPVVAPQHGYTHSHTCT
jgi:hypothetical protein